MTPLQLAHAECANWNNGACDGMRFDDNLAPLPGKALPKCLLASGQRCDYFEECVLPMAAMVSDPARAKAYLAAAADYKFQHHISGHARRCPDCGGPLPARKKFCADCAAKRRRNTFRESQSRIRGLAVNS